MISRQDDETDKLSTYSLNQYLIKLRPIIKQSREHIVKHLVKSAQKYRKKKTQNDHQKGQNEKRAERLIEEVMALKGFHNDDVSKFALLTKKSFAVVGSDGKSTGAERIMCRFAEHKKVSESITQFRENYPQWEQEVPYLMKLLGLRHRKKKLKGLKEKGKYDDYMERENRVLLLLNSSGGLEIDEKLLQRSKLITLDDIKINPKYDSDKRKKPEILSASQKKRLRKKKTQSYKKMGSYDPMELLKEGVIQSFEPSDSQEEDKKQNIDLDITEEVAPEEQNLPPECRPSDNENKPEPLSGNRKKISVSLNRSNKRTTEHMNINDKNKLKFVPDDHGKLKECHSSINTLIQDIKDKPDHTIHSNIEEKKMSTNIKSKIKSKQIKPKPEVKCIDLPQLINEGKSIITLESNPVNRCNDLEDDEDFFIKDSTSRNKTSFFLGRECGSGDEEEAGNGRNEPSYKTQESNYDFDSSIYFRKRKYRDLTDNADPKEERGRDFGKHIQGEDFKSNHDGSKRRASGHISHSNNFNQDNYRHNNHGNQRYSDLGDDSLKKESNTPPSGLSSNSTSTLHPSWEAKKKQQAASIAVFKGNHITFDD